MDTEQLNKLGPLGLRLIEGLRGPALQVARNLQIDKLSAEDGASYLLKGLQTSLQPRSKQEARDLYQAGAQVGGMLSRQSTEAMSNYVLRRRAWHSAMVDLDPELTLPEGIRTEQLLLNAGITPDQQLMVRTAINGDMTWNKVCDELIAQPIAREGERQGWLQRLELQRRKRVQRIWKEKRELIQILLC